MKVPRSPRDEEARRVVTEAYSLVGGVATGFSALEFHLQFVLSTLISGNEVSSEAMLAIRQKQFGQRIELLKDLVILRFPRGSKLRAQGIALVSSLNKLREKRNLYVHGYWLINYPLLASTGGVSCSDTKWRFDRKTESWTSMKTYDISLSELRRQITATGKLFKELYAFNEAIQSALHTRKS